jgi:hypothetical protein
LTPLTKTKHDDQNYPKHVDRNKSKHIDLDTLIETTLNPKHVDRNYVLSESMC